MTELSCNNCIWQEKCAGNDSRIFPCPDFERMYKVLNEAIGKFTMDSYSSSVEAWRNYMYTSKGIIDWIA